MKQATARRSVFSSEHTTAECSLSVPVWILTESLRRAKRSAGRVNLHAEAGLDLTELSYAWLLSRPGVDSVIIGPGTVEHLDAALDAISLALDAALCAKLDAIYVTHQGTDARYARI